MLFDGCVGWLMVFNATFNNVSVLSLFESTKTDESKIEELFPSSFPLFTNINNLVS